MKAILIKRSETDYKLYVNDKTFATSLESPYKRLAIKNCENVFNNYDLEELAKKAEIDVFNGFDGLPGDLAKMAANIGFRKGFQKALELLKDKKFDENAIYDSVMLGAAFDDPGIKGIETYNDLKDLAIKRNTLTKIEVEIVMCDFIGISDNYTPENFPKLDSNNCLILKRI